MTEDLAGRWRSDATRLRAWGCDDQATILERCAGELEEHSAGWGSTALSLEAAAGETGYSAAHLRRLIARGVLADVGQNGETAVLRRELPYKPGRQRHPLPLGTLSSI
ncbi:MAG: hypothetical protein IIA44_10905 [Acidobacteria bacterium]|nr:hypothetical protein [Acidobacteriota bacterium]